MAANSFARVVGNGSQSQMDFHGFIHPHHLSICKSSLKAISPGEGGNIGLFITLVPKVFLFVGLITTGTF